MTRTLHFFCDSRPAEYILLLPALFIAFTLSAQSQLLRDINPHEDVASDEYSNLTVGGNKVYFIVNNTELWKTTGNTGGTVRIKPFDRIQSLTCNGSTAYFVADDGSGQGLWKTTGTFASTVKIKEFPLGWVSQLTVIGDVLYFSAYATGFGQELWRTDGTAGGTTMIRDIRPGKMGSDPASFVNVNGVLYFTANDGKTGHELWKSDGTASGTVLVKDVRSGDYRASAPEYLTNVNGTVFFVAFDDATGRELYKSDGTTEGTVRLADIRPGKSDPGIRNVTAVNNTLFFTANDGVHGHELWKSDGSAQGTVMVKDMTPGRNGSSRDGKPFMHPMGNFKSVFGLLYYTAYQGDTYYVCKSDGTESGTVPLFVATHAIAMPAPRFVPMGNSIYYFDASEDEDSYYEFHLYRMNADGSNPVIITTLQIQDFYTTYDPELVMLNNTLYFWGRDGIGEGFKLFRSNGAVGNRVLIKDVYKAGLGSSPNGFARMGDHVYFVAESELFEPRLWKTDGTSSGTSQLEGIDGTYGFVATSSHLYYTHGYPYGIWKTDGTTEGNVLVKSDLNIYSVFNLLAVGEKVFFEASPEGLWVTDGTSEGTVQLTAERTYWKEAAGNQLLFTIDRGNKVIELWRSNGTPEGTSHIRTFSGDRFPAVSPRAVSGNVLYFVADDGSSGNEVWRTDGTASGTWRMADLNANDDHLDGGEDDIRSLTVWNDHVYVSAFDNSNSWSLYKLNETTGNVTKIRSLNPIGQMIATPHRLHLFVNKQNDRYSETTHWVTDGSSEGTESISNEVYPNTIDYAVVDDVVYFRVHGNLWRSDGTACGTFAVDIRPTDPNQITLFGDRLIFSAFDPDYGFEPHVFSLADAPANPCGEPAFAMARLADDDAANALGIASYPNPFKTEISLNVRGDESDIIDVQVFTNSGFPVEKFSGLNANTDYRFGASWKPGHYILQVNISGKVTSQQVLKE